MKNQRSTVAMRLAHKIAKAFPKLSFSSALRYAWKQVRIDMTIAERMVNGDYKIIAKRRRTSFGTVSDIVFMAKGVKHAVKRFFAGMTRNDHTISLWAGW